MTTKLDIISPLDKDTISQLRAGDIISFSGVIYTARDAAHAKIATLIQQGQVLPFNPVGQTLYYMGPSPTPPGCIIGACGPTTSSRMDPFTPAILQVGVRVLLGKGERTAMVKEALVRYGAVYMVTYGGAGALLAKAVRRAEVIAYPELGAEAMLRLEITEFPAIVAYDMYGGDLFAEEIPKYAQESA
ncbi:MAG: FumA C-terminus/TtdB family hydratase beta subunit [Dehalococcoidia bacterium]|nr:FumA C-terminus/TtdB family hydratase beta subunit [Dehalococcoidia bacterium]